MRMSYQRKKSPKGNYCGVVCRLYPNRTQERAFEATFEAVDAAYDELLGWCVGMWSERYGYPKKPFVDKAIAGGKVWKEGPAASLPDDVLGYVEDAVLKALERATRSDPPVPRAEKAQRYNRSYTTKGSGGDLPRRDGRKHLAIPGVGSVKASIPREFAHIYSVTVRRVPDGRYFASVLTWLPTCAAATANTKAVVVASLGTDVLVRLEGGGAEWACPKAWRKNRDRLADADRRLSSQEPGSDAWERERRRRARLHAHVAAIRHDWTHKLTNELTRDYGEIWVPTTNFADLIEGNPRASFLTDAAWGELVRQLRYKCKWRGVALHEVEGKAVRTDGGVELVPEVP